MLYMSVTLSLVNIGADNELLIKATLCAFAKGKYLKI